jgi:hypothetical protein
VLLFLSYRYKRHCDADFDKQHKANLIVLGSIVTYFVLYIYTMGATYVYKFSEYEAIRLASYQRYISIVFLCIVVVIVLTALSSWNDISNKQGTSALAILLAVLMTISPTANLYYFIDGRGAVNANITRVRYEAMTNQILNTCDGDDKIYVVSQKDAGLDFLILRFTVKPNFVVGATKFGPPINEGDSWTVMLTAEEWRTLLLEKNYDYVAVYFVDDYFLERYSSLFVNPEEIQNNTLFRVNRETGMLERCPAYDE